MSTEFTKENISKIETQVLKIEGRLIKINQSLRRAKTTRSIANWVGLFCAILFLTGVIYNIGVLSNTGFIIVALSTVINNILIRNERNLLEERFELLEGLQDRNEWMAKTKQKKD